MEYGTLKAIALSAGLALTCFSAFAEKVPPGADSLTWSVPVQSGVSAVSVVESLKNAAVINNLLYLGESPLYKQVQAMTGERYRYVNFLTFGDPVLSRSLLDHSDRYAAFLPIRIAVVEDRDGKFWLYSLNLDLMLQSGEGLTSAAKKTALALHERVLKMINDAAIAESKFSP